MQKQEPRRSFGDDPSLLTDSDEVYMQQQKMQKPSSSFLPSSDPNMLDLLSFNNSQVTGNVGDSLAGIGLPHISGP